MGCWNSHEYLSGQPDPPPTPLQLQRQLSAPSAHLSAVYPMMSAGGFPAPNGSLDTDSSACDDSGVTMGLFASNSTGGGVSSTFARSVEHARAFHAEAVDAVLPGQVSVVHDGPALSLLPPEPPPAVAFEERVLPEMDLVSAAAPSSPRKSPLPELPPCPPADP
eukprot:RCo024798